MPITSPRLRRLDGALEALPPESDAMLLSELDGFIAAVVASPEPIPPEEWLPVVWGDGEVSPFEDERDARWYRDLVVEHHASVVAALAKGAGRYRPFLEVDVAKDEILWELWIEGFAAGMDLRPDAWAALEDDGEEGVTEAAAGLSDLVEIALGDGALERELIDRLTEEAPRLIPRWIEVLAARAPASGVGDASATEPDARRKVGRNDPCPCGSGRKHKRCCGQG